MKRKTVLTNLKCLECGNIQPIQRSESLQKKIGHIKTMYCYKCKKRTKFYELRNLFIETDKTTYDILRQNLIELAVKEKEENK